MNQKTDKIIKIFKEIHGDKYDYSKINFKSYSEKVIVICKFHGEFTITPNHHKKGVDCAKCKGRNLTTEDFIKEAIIVHGEKYKYEKSIYINNSSKIIITCIIHGDFEQSRHNHVGKKHGCSECAEISRKISKSKPLDQFIIEAKEIHGDKYEYSKSVYTNNQTKLIIICKIHGDFLMIPSSHIYKKVGCPECSTKKKLNNEIFIKKAKEIHGDKYDYSELEYKNINSKVDIICNIHGKFQQLAISHLNKSGCSKCGKISCNQKNTFTQEEFIQKANNLHEYKYNYSKTEYIKSNQKIIIICNKGHEFTQLPSYHLDGCGCTLCYNKSEGKLYKKLISIYPNLKIQFKASWCRNKTFLPFDFCLEEEKIIIEVDGNQHFKQVRNWSTPEKQQENDKFKMKCANENKYSIIRILQEHIYKNKYDWYNKLINAIQKIIDDNIIQNIFICENNEYNTFF